MEANKPQFTVREIASDFGKEMRNTGVLIEASDTIIKERLNYFIRLLFPLLKKKKKSRKHSEEHATEFSDNTERAWNRRKFTPTHARLLIRALEYKLVRKMTARDAFKLAMEDPQQENKSAPKAPPVKPIMAFMLLSPLVGKTEKMLKDVIDSGLAVEAGTLFGDWDIFSRLETNTLAELHGLYVRLTHNLRIRNKAKLLLATDPRDKSLCWIEKGESPFEKDSKNALAYVLVESRNDGLALLKELKRESKRRGHARTVWAASVVSGDADVIALVSAPDTDSLFEYLMLKFRERDDVIQTNSYLIRKSTYWVNRD